MTAVSSLQSSPSARLSIPSPDHAPALLLAQLRLPRAAALPAAELAVVPGTDEVVASAVAAGGAVVARAAVARGSAEVLAVDVQPAHRRKGLGTLVLRAALEAAGGGGQDAVPHAYVSADVAPGVLAFFAAEGFSAVAKGVAAAWRRVGEGEGFRH